MKSLIKKTIYVLIFFACKLYPYSFNVRIRNIRDKIYTIWVRNFIRQVGDGVIISYPCTFNGKGYDNVIIGKGTIIYKNCIIESWQRYIQQDFSPLLEIGEDCRIGEYTHITAINHIVIGHNLLTGRFVIITDHSHGKNLSKYELNEAPALRHLYSKGEVIIGNNVWIGDKVSILPGTHIGDNVIIGSNAVVTGNFPSNCIIAGVPAKIIKRISS